MFAFDSNIAAKNFLSSFDYLIICVVFLLHIITIRYSPTISNTFSLNSKKLSLTLFVPTLVVSWYGKFFYVTQTAFDNGISNFYTQGIFWYIAYMVFAFYFVKKIRNYNAATLPDLISKMYDGNSIFATSILVVIKSLPITYLISLITAIQIFIGISFEFAIFITLLCLIIYSQMKSMHSYLYSNIIHFFCVVLAFISVVIFAVMKIGSFDFLYANLPTSYFQPRGAHGLTYMLTWFALAFSTTFMSPIFYQHCIAAKSDRIATFGILLCTCLWILIDICTTTGAMYAKAIFPNANAMQAYGLFLTHILPDGIRGLVVVGIIGTIIPSISAGLAIAKESLSFDLLKIKSASHHKVVSVVFTCGMIGLFVLTLASQDTFIEILTLGKKYFSGCLLVPMLIGFFIPHLITLDTFLSSVIVSFVTMTAWYFYGQSLIFIEPIIIGCITAFFVFIIKYYQNKINIEYNFAQAKSNAKI